ncbi:hypothetical protein CDL15_Pgr017957 [Punica granatum]|uniref:Uncharacterized protein n=1 Tax=Punica granatum TaxID=22663 RepID=A0A218WGU0_PUNGR|nr:hypothetical protein CDL15_Pgr017957 [Punica granatum]
MNRGSTAMAHEEPVCPGCGNSNLTIPSREKGRSSLSGQDTHPTTKIKTPVLGRGGRENFSTMNGKVGDVRAAAMEKNFKGGRPLPKRGQIKSRIAANAFHSIVSAISRASSSPHRHPSSRQGVS